MPDLSEALHARMDAMGAPPRENAPAPEPEEAFEDLEQEPLETEGEDESEVEAEEPAAEGEAVAAPEKGDKFKVADLAEAIGWTPADLYNDLIVPFGNGKSATLGELKNQFDTIEAQRAEIEGARRQIAQEVVSLRQQQQALLSGMSEATQELDDARGEMRAIEAQYANVDWERLDAQDPGRAANIRQKFAAAYAQAQGKVQQAEQGQAQRLEQARGTMIQAEDERTLALIPEWRDPQVARSELTEITRYLVEEVGFSPTELGTIYKAEARVVARDAWRYRQMMAKTKQTTDTLRKAPKRVLRPGKGQTANLESQARTLEKRALATQNPRDKLEAARAMLNLSRSKR